MHTYRWFYRIGILGMLFLVWSTPAHAAEFPKTFRVVVSETDHTVTLLGNSDSLGSNTTITLKDTARFLQVATLKPHDTTYPIILTTNPSHTSVYLKLYHPDGTLLSARRLWKTKPNQHFSSVRIDNRKHDGRHQLWVRGVRQNKNNKAVLYQSAYLSIKPASSQPVFTITDHKRGGIAIPTVTSTGKKATLTWINYYRKIAGLIPVRASDALDTACSLHVTYMVNHDTLTHTEDPAAADYTTNGAAAGVASDLASGTTSLQHATELWIHSLYHRLPILDPALTHIGQAYSSQGGYACLHLGTTDNNWDEFAWDPIAFPAPGQTNVPTTFISGEVPDPLHRFSATYPAGEVITLTFNNLTTVNSMTVTLTDSANQVINGYLQLPHDNDDPYSAGQGNTVSFIPVDPLDPAQTYTVSMTGVVNGAAYQKYWSFTTMVEE